MRRLAALACLAVSVTMSPAAALAAPRRCKAATAAQRKQEAEQRAFTEKQYAAALAQLELTPVQLTSSSRFVRPPAERPVGTTFEENGKTYLAGPVNRVPSNSGPPASLELARNAAGEIVQIVRAPRLKSSRTVLVCGCSGLGGGAGPHEEQTIYELPAGAKFAGAVTVAYDARVYTLQPSNTTPAGRQCDPVP